MKAGKKIKKIPGLMIPIFDVDKSRPKKQIQKSQLEYRMYGLVPYNISEIQKGIQFGHAVVEYSQAHFKDKDYQEWANEHKTFIILNGGTTNEGKSSHKGSMQEHLKTLIENGIKTEEFYEPDLNDTLTAIVFLVDERVFNKTKYPPTIGSRELEREPSKKDAEKWAASIGGKKNAFLRDFLSGFRLA